MYCGNLEQMEGCIARQQSIMIFCLLVVAISTCMPSIEILGGRYGVLRLEVLCILHRLSIMVLFSSIVMMGLFMRWTKIQVSWPGSIKRGVKRLMTCGTITFLHQSSTMVLYSSGVAITMYMHLIVGQEDLFGSLKRRVYFMHLL